MEVERDLTILGTPESENVVKAAVDRDADVDDDQLLYHILITLLVLLVNDDKFVSKQVRAYRVVVFGEVPSVRTLIAAAKFDVPKVEVAVVPPFVEAAFFVNTIAVIAVPLVLDGAVLA